MSIQAAIDELRAYKGPLALRLHAGADEALLQAVEQTYNITLPDDFKEFYHFSDGFETDEDIFNMIPLAEIIDNKRRHNGKTFHIAEYMIYSDMWQLEINPDNCNDYKIFVGSNYNKLVLTNSLAEFITRFLKGGVFDPGGLYDWQEEVELLPIYSTKLKTAETLLTVFYYGMVFGLISRQEVIDWVDQLIKHENEPEYFFIELSLSHDTNEMLRLLNSLHVPKSDTEARAILGLLYQRLSAGVIPVNEAIAILDKYSFAYGFTNLLTQDEQDYIYNFTEFWQGDPTIDADKLTEDVLSFLLYYKELQLVDYKYWLGRSYQVEYNFKNALTASGTTDERAL